MSLIKQELKKIETRLPILPIVRMSRISQDLERVLEILRGDRQ